MWPKGGPWLLVCWLVVLLVALICLIFDLDALDLHFDALGALVAALGLHCGDPGHFLAIFCTYGRMDSNSVTTGMQKVIFVCQVTRLRKKKHFFQHPKLQAGPPPRPPKR